MAANAEDPRRAPDAPFDTAFEETVRALSECEEDALSKAACGGLLDPAQVIDWAVRTTRLVLYQRDRSELRSEVPMLAERLGALLEQIPLPDGLEPDVIAARVIERLPEIRALIAEDVEAAFASDPAASSFDEIVVSYPSVLALSIYRLAHELHTRGVPLLPRIMSEYAHGRTGIDIHPGARIGRRFFIDHGTGVVIGETAVVGNRVRIYQGVTLGALSVVNREALAGVKRHPTIEDDVVIYAGTTILGGDTRIGEGSVIGGNTWITESVPAGSRVMAEPARYVVRQHGPDDENGASEPVQLQWDI